MSNIESEIQLFVARPDVQAFLNYPKFTEAASFAVLHALQMTAAGISIPHLPDVLAAGSLKELLGLDPTHPDRLGIPQESGDYPYQLIAYELGSTDLRPTCKIIDPEATKSVEGVFYATIRITRDVGQLKRGMEAIAVVNSQTKEVRLQIGNIWYIAIADPRIWVDRKYHPGWLRDITEQIAREEEAIREKLRREKSAAAPKQESPLVRQLRTRIEGLTEELEDAQRALAALGTRNKTVVFNALSLKEEATRAYTRMLEICLGEEIAQRLLQLRGQEILITRFTSEDIAIQTAWVFRKLDEITRITGRLFNKEERKQIADILVSINRVSAMDVEGLNF
jgi:hypothetical protein